MTLLRILSFDPAAGNMGYAVIEYDKQEDKLYVLKCGIINGDKVMRQLRKDMLPIYGKQYTVLCAITDTLIQLLKDIQPDYVAVEGPFSHLFVSAYASLKLVVDRIRQVSHLVLNKNIYEIQPKEAKAYISTGTADKQDVKEAVLNHKNIIFKFTDNRDITTLADHEYDAIIIGYSFIRKHVVP